MQNHFEYRKCVSYTFLIFICLQLWVSDCYTSQLQRDVRCMFILCSTVDSEMSLMIVAYTFFFYILCTYPKTLWWLTVSLWHLSLPSQCHLFRQSACGGTTCEWGHETIFCQVHTPHYAWRIPQFPSSHYKMHITFLIIFHCIRSNIHHCWYFQKLVFDIACTGVVISP
jgi:hypothetical protein